MEMLELGSEEDENIVLPPFPTLSPKAIAQLLSRPPDQFPLSQVSAAAKGGLNIGAEAVDRYKEKAKDDSSYPDDSHIANATSTPNTPPTSIDPEPTRQSPVRAQHNITHLKSELEDPGENEEPSTTTTSAKEPIQNQDASQAELTKERERPSLLPTTPPVPEPPTHPHPIPPNPCAFIAPTPDTGKGPSPPPPTVAPSPKTKQSRGSSVLTSAKPSASKAPVPPSPARRPPLPIHSPASSGNKENNGNNDTDNVVQKPLVSPVPTAAMSLSSKRKVPAVPPSPSPKSKTRKQSRDTVPLFSPDLKPRPALQASPVGKRASNQAPIPANPVSKGTGTRGGDGTPAKRRSTALPKPSPLGAPRHPLLPTPSTSTPPPPTPPSSNTPAPIRFPISSDKAKKQSGPVSLERKRRGSGHRSPKAAKTVSPPRCATQVKRGRGRPPLREKTTEKLKSQRTAKSLVTDSQTPPRVPIPNFL